MNQVERRSTARPVEIRSEGEGKSVCHGYAAVFYSPSDPGSQYQLWEGVYERIMPGAFDRMLREQQDVRALFNHSPDSLLGRVSAGTLRLSIDSIGLRYEIDLPDNTAGRDTKESLARGDLKESSFSFNCYRNGKVSWVDQTIDGVELSIRQIEDCDVMDVGPVTFAAYDSTTSGIRSGDREQLEAEVAELRKQRRTGQDEADEIDIRMRMIQIVEEDD